MAQKPEAKEAEGGSGEQRPGLLGDLPALAGAVVVALLIRTFLFQSFYVPSDSMLPTLLVGDHVFVNKLVYGPVLPGADDRGPAIRKPHRGEVIVFHLARGAGGIYPIDERPSLPREAFVKRLIGLPGDRVAVRDGRLVLNGEVVAARPTGDHFRDSSGHPYDVWEEDLPGCRHLILDDPHNPGIDLPEITVREGRYLFMGDNRDNSYDGRRFGTVRAVDLAGPAGLLYWSWDWNGSWFALLNPVTWWDNLTERTRWSRMGRFHECVPPATPTTAAVAGGRAANRG